MFFETGVARGIDCRDVRGGTPSRSPEHPGGPPPPVLLPPGTSAVPGNEQPWGRGFVLGGQNRQTIRVTPPGDQAANLAAEITENPPPDLDHRLPPTHPGGKAAAAATRLLDLSEINNLVKSQDQAGAREGAPGETSTTTRAEKKRKPVSLVHQAPAGRFSAL